MPSALSPTSDEFELVRLAARAELSSQREQALAAAVTDDLDWREVMRLGTYHKTLPLLYAHLRDREGVPPALSSALRNRSLTVSGHVLFLSAEMARIARRMEEDGVAYLVLKGPSLSLAYGGIAQRPFVDNDLLVQREDFGRVEAALLALGFQERKRSDQQQSRYLRVHGEYTFGRAVGRMGSTVDVHTRLVHVGYSYAPDFDRLLARARWIDVAGASVPSLSWDDLFLALSVNALKDQWDRLRLVSDIAEVARFVEDWPGVLDMASRHRVLRSVHLAVLLASRLVDGEFPDHVLRQAQQDRSAVRLAGMAHSAMRGGREGEVPSWLERAKLNMLVQDGVRGRLRYTTYAAVRRVTESWVTPHR